MRRHARGLRPVVPSYVDTSRVANERIMFAWRPVRRHARGVVCGDQTRVSTCSAAYWGGNASLKSAVGKAPGVCRAGRPLGGSLVSLMPHWRTGTGNVGDGIADSHRRKSLWRGAVS